MRPQVWTAVGAVAGGLAVACGAFGAHWLKSPETIATWSLSPRDLENFETAARYQLFHALAVVAAGLTGMHGKGRFAGAAAAAFVLGTVLFSGSLYAHVLTHQKAFGMIVPLGGVSFIVGWVLLAFAALAASPAASSQETPGGNA